MAFLDRDGTINEKAPEGEYIMGPDEVRLLPGAAQAIRRLNDAGVSAIVISNQRGIALGRMSESDLMAVHEQLAAQLRDAAGARIDAFFFCPHDEGQCDCRKPQTGMFRQAVAQFPWIDLAGSVMIGDSPTDVEAGTRIGARGLQIGVDAEDLAGAVDVLLGSEGRSDRRED